VIYVTKQEVFDEKKNIAFILVNGRNCIFADGMDTEIGDDNVVDILPLVAGG
jgi:molybdopterin converting factor small subunit